MHIYEKDGVEYPSVTTVLSIVSKDDTLMKWANHMGFKHKDIEKIKEETTAFGTLVHANLQGIVDSSFTDIPKCKDNIEQYQIDKIKRNFNEYFMKIPYTTIATERTIISEELGYAGTLDWQADISGYHFLNDFKTAKKLHETMFLQLGGYYNLLKSIGEDIDYGSIIIINEMGCCMHPITKDQLSYYGEVFNSLLKFYKEFTSTQIIAPDYDILNLIKTSC